MDTTNVETQTPIISLTDAALKEVKRLINVQGIEEGGLRLGVKGGGCSGLSYTINFDDKIGQYDQVYEIDGVKVIVDAKSKPILPMPDDLATNKIRRKQPDKKDEQNEGHDA